MPKWICTGVWTASESGCIVGTAAGYCMSSTRSIVSRCVNSLLRLDQAAKFDLFSPFEGVEQRLLSAQLIAIGWTSSSTRSWAAASAPIQHLDQENLLWFIQTLSIRCPSIFATAYWMGFVCLDSNNFFAQNGFLQPSPIQVPLSTFEVLDAFHQLTLQAKTNMYDYLKMLQSRTDNTGTSREIVCLF